MGAKTRPWQTDDSSEGGPDHPQIGTLKPHEDDRWVRFGLKATHGSCSQFRPAFQGPKRERRSRWRYNYSPISNFPVVKVNILSPIERLDEGVATSIAVL
jgi:hypothetical protein